MNALQPIDIDLLRQQRIVKEQQLRAIEQKMRTYSIARTAMIAFFIGNSLTMNHPLIIPINLALLGGIYLSYKAYKKTEVLQKQTIDALFEIFQREGAVVQGEEIEVNEPQVDKTETLEELCKKKGIAYPYENPHITKLKKCFGNTDKIDANMPLEYQCPISLSVMYKPTYTEGCKTRFEHHELLLVIVAGGKHPYTGAVLKEEDLIIDEKLEAEIHNHVNDLSKVKPEKLNVSSASLFSPTSALSAHPENPSEKKDRHLKLD